jgi:hypothetical protein
LPTVDAGETTLRSHAEDVPMARTDGGETVTWAGTNSGGVAEQVICRPAPTTLSPIP